jgi:hypothetical protein
MNTLAWDSEAERFLKRALEDRWKWFAKLLFALTMFARNTYVVGGSGLADPERMRCFNELTHRTAQQLKNLAVGYKGMPDTTFLEGVGRELAALDINPERLVEMLR